MPVAERTKTENLQVKSRGFSFRHPGANPTNFREARDAYLKRRARRIMRQRSFQRLMRSEIFLHAADVSGSREMDARVPKSAIDHGEHLKKAVKGPPTYNGWEYCVYYEYLFRESATFSVRLA